MKTKELILTVKNCTNKCVRCGKITALSAAMCARCVTNVYLAKAEYMTVKQYMEFCERLRIHKRKSIKAP